MLKDRIDEMFGAALLAGIAVYAMNLGIDGGTISACIAGVIALLSVEAAKKKKN